MALAWLRHLPRGCSCPPSPSPFPRKPPGVGDSGPWLPGKEQRGRPCQGFPVPSDQGKNLLQDGVWGFPSTSCKHI